MSLEISSPSLMVCLNVSENLSVTIKKAALDSLSLVFKKWHCLVIFIITSKDFFFYHYWFSTLPRHTRNRQISCTPNFSLVTFLLITENTGNSFCGTYLRLSLCVLYSSSVFGGKLRTLRNVSRILAVVDESDAVLFHTDIISSYERLKNVT